MSFFGGKIRWNYLMKQNTYSENAYVFAKENVVKCDAKMAQNIAK